MGCNSCAKKLAAQSLPDGQKEIRISIVRTNEGKLGFCDPGSAKEYARLHGNSREGSRWVKATLDGQNEWSVSRSALNDIVLAENQNCIVLVD